MPNNHIFKVRKKIIMFYAKSCIIIFSARGGGNHHHLWENYDFSATKHPVDPKSICKLEFVHCGLVEKKRVLHMSRFDPGGQTKIERTFFQIQWNNFSEDNSLADSHSFNVRF